MRPPKYKFYITVGDGEQTEVTPHFSKLLKSYEKEDEQQFFRAKLSGDMVFVGYDYELVRGADLEDDITMVCTKYNYDTGGWDGYFTGTFSKTDCKFDYAARTCTISEVQEDDEYEAVLDGYDDTYDLIELAPPTTAITLHKRMAVQVYIAGADTVSTFFNGTYLEEDVDEEVDDEDELVSTYHFALTDRSDEFMFTFDMNPLFGGLYRKYGTESTIWSSDTMDVLEIRLVKVVSEGDAYIASLVSGNAHEITNGNTKAVSIDYTTYDMDVYRLQFFYGQTLYAHSDYFFYVDDTSDIFLYAGFGSLGFTIEDGISIGGQDVSGWSIQGITEIVNNGVYERMLCDADTVAGLSTYDLDDDDFVHSSNSNFTKCIGTSGVFGRVFFTTATTTESTKYGKNDDGEYFTDNFLPSSSGYSRPMPVSRSFWANVSVWYAYNDSFWSILEPQVRVEYTLKDCWNIADVISKLLAKIAPWHHARGYRGIQPVPIWHACLEGCIVLRVHRAEIERPRFRV